MIKINRTIIILIIGLVSLLALFFDGYTKTLETKSRTLNAIPSAKPVINVRLEDGSINDN